MKKKNDLTWFRIIQPSLDEMKRALVQKKINPSAIYIYLWIKAGVHYKNGELEISQSHLAKKSGLSSSAVKRAIDLLLSNGFIVNHATIGQTAVYRVIEIAELMVNDKLEKARWQYIPANEEVTSKKLKKYISGEQNKPPLNVNIVQNIQNIQINIYEKNVVSPQEMDAMKVMINNPNTPENFRKKLEELYTGQK